MKVPHRRQGLLCTTLDIGHLDFLLELWKQIAKVYFPSPMVGKRVSMKSPGVGKILET